MIFKYDSNSSGGGWWLGDEDWRKLERGGWKVDWVVNQPKGLMHKEGQDRWLGALARSASKSFETLPECVADFEKLTGQDASDEGCNCCGPPHSFSWDGGYASGEDVIRELYPDAPKTLREAIEKGIKK